ncbi:conserved membrane protein of unknown function [Nitrospira sp. KM1]|uniref:DUF1295 domain-containing protein n=1 Tax=Nitrospira sp. KM1 TaxID=1936990 RepID=UPI0013A7423B|nr:DUF1295 domain-containing protein [Nitrospira sp. KM1]BCA55215.1 conserved membrane protein of unknown function [Nitrospira sp. KM1]
MTATDPLASSVVVYVAMVVIMSALWLIQRTVQRNASLADLGWCLGLIVSVCWHAASVPGDIERKVLIVSLVTFYAGRLGYFILVHRIMGKQEDARYAALRRQWGPYERLLVFGYFQMQAVAVAVFSLPCLVAMQNPRPPFGLWELGGFLVGIIAVGGEALADYQLTRFRSRPDAKGHVCRDGFWMYSRHPNYFFEWLYWWSYVVMAAGSPGWPLTWIGPVVMGLALIKWTGIPWAEAQALKSRGRHYRDYQRTTNAFFPWFPKS